MKKKRQIQMTSNFYRPQEQAKWNHIYAQLVHKLGDKVYEAKTCRYRGLFSPKRLQNKIKFDLMLKKQKEYCENEDENDSSKILPNITNHKEKIKDILMMSTNSHSSPPNEGLFIISYLD
jgi:hypothetical protein